MDTSKGGHKLDIFSTHSKIFGENERKRRKGYKEK
jgi:hypothetical protein